MELGGPSLLEVNLTIPQGTSFYLEIIHKDKSGNVVDHRGSTLNMVFQDKKDKRTVCDLSEYCAATAQSIVVNIPKAVTLELPVGKKHLNWDIFAETQAGGSTRLCNGVVTVLDTYSLDGQD